MKSQTKEWESPIRISFPNLTKLDKYGKYSCEILLNVNHPQCGEFELAYNKAIEEGCETHGKKFNLLQYKNGAEKKIGLRSGAIEKPGQEYMKDLYFMQASGYMKSKVPQQIPIYGLKRNLINNQPIQLSDDEINKLVYPGMHCNFIFNLYPCINDFGVKVLINCQGIQLLMKGERFGNSVDVESAFDFENAEDVLEEEPIGF
jgi:hypothetical protein